MHVLVLTFSAASSYENIKNISNSFITLRRILYDTLQDSRKEIWSIILHKVYQIEQILVFSTNGWVIQFYPQFLLYLKYSFIVHESAPQHHHQQLLAAMSPLQTNMIAGNASHFKNFQI